MSLAAWAWALAAGMALGGFQFVALARGVSGLLGGGSGRGRRRVWLVLSMGRLLVTLALGLALIRAFGLPPEGIGLGLILAFAAGRVWLCRGQAADSLERDVEE